MLELVPPVAKPKKRARGCYETLVAECVDLIAAGKARFASEAAWLVCRNHPNDEINVLTLEGYVRMARRFSVNAPEARATA